MFTDEREKDRELDMLFHFQHMEADCLFTEYIPTPFSLRKLKRAFTRWQKALEGIGWNALYLENHDHPRVISRYGSEKYRNESGKMLASAYLFQKGTPFLYQGQEIGMVNYYLDSINQYKDCVAINYFFDKDGRPRPKLFDRIRKATRDNSRTVMQWSHSKNAGFSEHEPWFVLNPNYEKVNVEDEEKDPNSVLSFYRRAIAYRTSNDVIRCGSYKEYYRRSRALYVYGREYEGRKILVICSFRERPATFRFPKDFDWKTAQLVLSNYEDTSVEDGCFRTKAYETRVYEW